MLHRIIRFTGIPFKGKPWPEEAPWQLSADRNPYMAFLPDTEENKEYIKSLYDVGACCFYTYEEEWKLY